MDAVVSRAPIFESRGLVGPHFIILDPSLVTHRNVEANIDGSTHVDTWCEWALRLQDNTINVARKVEHCVKNSFSASREIVYRTQNGSSVVSCL